MRAALALALVAALVIPIASAQPDPSSLTVSFDLSGDVRIGVVPGFAAPTRLYFLMLNLAEPIKGYENGISISGPGSEDWIIQISPWPGLEIDIVPDDPYSYIVNIGACVGATGSNYLIKTFDFAYFLAPQAPLNTLVCAGPPTTGVPSIPGTPSYRNCDDQLSASALAAAPLFPGLPDGCAVLNCTLSECTVATESRSWGAVKAEY